MPGGKQEPVNAGSKHVYVIGGGVTGLTVAHELVDRGFRVTLVEDGRTGGLARTQWCYPGFTRATPSSASEGAGTVAEPADVDAIRVDQALEPRAGPGPALEPIFSNTVIDFAEGSFELDAQALSCLEGMTERLAEYRDEILKAGRPFNLHVIAVVGDAQEGEPLAGVSLPLRPGFPGIDDVTRFNGTNLPGERPARTLSRLRAAVVRQYLQRQLLKRLQRQPEAHVHLVDIGVGGGLPEVFDNVAERRVTFRVCDPRVPGEHGYRFFPSFYRHVFDTMKRIPILEPLERAPEELLAARELRRAIEGNPLSPTDLVESTRTVFDNLVPTLSFKIALGDRRPLIPVSRTRARSFRELSTLVDTLFRRVGIEARDLARFQLRIAKYLTSGKERRRTYEAQTWAEFVGVDESSKTFRDLLETWPQALIGIRASLADARTIGTIAAQLLLDQLSTGGVRDATLNGPTSVAWIDPWVHYLGRRDVTIVRGRLSGLRFEQGHVAPVWDDANPSGRRGGEAAPWQNVQPDYLVLAVPLREARRLIDSLWDAAEKDTRGSFPATLDKIRDFLGEPLPATDALPIEREGEGESGSLRHYGGIQFYLSHDMGPADGHVYLASSDWRLSAISQAQFWQRRLMRGELGDVAPGGDVISILSIDIGDWFARSRRNGLRAADCNHNQLANEVWKQVVEAMSTEAWTPPPPLAYHIDDDMIFGRDGKPAENRAPYLVNLAGGFERRPGPDDLTHGYEVFFDSLVVAGTYMKTHTRLATMESANESGRHAVNGLLAHYRRTTKSTTSRECQIWDPEQNELDDLQYLRDIDDELSKRGLPHMLDVLEVERLLDGAGVLDPEVVLSAVRRSLGLGGAAASAVAGLPLTVLRRALETLFGRD